MKYDKYLPVERLRPYVKYFAVSESEAENTYKIFPSTGLVIGFQYRGRLSTINEIAESILDSSGITGLSDSYKIFKNSEKIGTVLIYFTETGFTHFATNPTNELFNLSLSLDQIFKKNDISEVEERLVEANSDKNRIEIVEQFLISQLRDIQIDKLIVEAVKLIYQSKGSLRMKELISKLYISQSPFEKRFRKIVGTTPKKFASIIRFNAVLDSLNGAKSLSEICHENNFFDQAHFIKDFRQYTGNTPESFKRYM
ncbi:helix-turn-helix transcriptional regulator [Pedobacter ginsengisoli]|uniref:helix-turn-helix transcriptional regulator n=1 Tax=Pedobacter ginsengisoli TaxID=363852 RepID=UPI00254D989F|nr:helix-turn-helix transcriptional regulator [Pedobacter ginsengisoli]